MNLNTERHVDQFPSVDETSATLYSNFSFSNKVRDYCEQNAFCGVANDPFSKCAKCILVGDVAVGKTCLLNRFTSEAFNTDHKATIGVDFAVIKFKILKVLFQLQIWDTAGQERFQSIAINYYRGAHAAIIVFDMSEISSLSGTKKWSDQILQGRKGKVPLVFLVGTKADVLSTYARNFIEKEAKTIAQQLSAEYWTVSSKTGENVERLFNRVATLCFNDIITKTIERIEEEKRINAIQYHDSFVQLSRKHSNLTVIKSCYVHKCWSKR